MVYIFYELGYQSHSFLWRNVISEQFFIFKAEKAWKDDIAHTLIFSLVVHCVCRESFVFSYFVCPENKMLALKIAFLFVIYTHVYIYSSHGCSISVGSISSFQVGNMNSQAPERERLEIRAAATIPILYILVTSYL